MIYVYMNYSNVDKLKLIEKFVTNYEQSLYIHCTRRAPAADREPCDKFPHSALRADRIEAWPW
jgi:hypothetical protein